MRDRGANKPKDDSQMAGVRQVDSLNHKLVAGLFETQNNASKQTYADYPTPAPESTPNTGGVAPIFFKGQNGANGDSSANGSPYKGSPESTPGFGQNGPAIPTSPTNHTFERRFQTGVYQRANGLPTGDNKQTSGAQNGQPSVEMDAPIPQTQGRPGVSMDGDDTEPYGSPTESPTPPPGTKRQWRGTWGQTPPAVDNGGSGIPSGQPGGGSGPATGDGGAPRSAGGKQGGGSDLRKVVDQKKDFIESIITRPDRYTSLDFLAHSLIGGFGGYVWGGPLANWVDKGAKNWLVRSQGQPAWLDNLALLHQKNHGLSGNERILVPLFDQDRDLATQIAKLGEVLKPEVDRINQQIPSRVLNADEKALVGRYMRLTGQELPEGIHGELTAEDAALLNRHAELGKDINEIAASLHTHPADVLHELTMKDAELSAKLDQKISELEASAEVQKMKTSGEAALTDTERAVVAKHKFFTEYKADINKAPKDYGVSLTAEESGLVSSVRNTRAAIGELEPHVARQADLPALQREHSEVSENIKQREQALRAQVDPLFEKLRAGHETQLTADEKALLARYEFLKSGGTGQIPADVRLSADEAGLVADRQSVWRRLEQLDPQFGTYRDLKAQRERIDRQIAKAADDLIPKYTEIEKNLAVHGATALSAEDAKLLSRYKFLKDHDDWAKDMAVGAKPTKQRPAQPAAGVLTDDDLKLLVGREHLEGRITELEERSLKVARDWNGHAKNFAKGVLTAEAAQFIDDRLDSWIFGKLKTAPSWYTDSLAIPAAMLLPGGWFKKGAAMVGMHFAGKVLDHCIPADPNSTWSRLMAPNWTESFFMAGAATIPMHNATLAKRAAYMGAVWAGSHVIPTVSSYLGYHLFGVGGDIRDIRDDAVKSFVADKSQRSSSSLNDSIKMFNKLGHDSQSGAAALKWYLGDWLSRKHDDLLNGYRGAAILFTAAGETELKNGTFIPGAQGATTGNPIYDVWNAVVHQNHNFSYMFAGKNLDLGGNALSRLVSAKIELERAKTETDREADQGVSNHGTAVSKSEKSALDAVETRVENDINKIYAKHDIPDAYKQLLDFIGHTKHDVVGQLYMDLRSLINKSGTQDPRYQAKLYRDLALIDLAFAGAKVNAKNAKNSDGSGAVSLVNEAQYALKKAHELDPGNEDTPQLDALVGDVAKQVPANVKSQGFNMIHNPFGIQNWQPLGQ